MKYSRKDIAKGFLKQLNSKGQQEALKELAALLLEQELHDQVDEIINDIALEYHKKYGVIEATVKTAFKISAELKSKLSEIIKQKTGAKTVIINEEVDRTLIGGVILTAPGMELDLSIKSKLAKLRA